MCLFRKTKMKKDSSNISEDNCKKLFDIMNRYTLLFWPVKGGTAHRIIRKVGKDDVKQQKDVNDLMHTIKDVLDMCDFTDTEIIKEADGDKILFYIMIPTDTKKHANNMQMVNKVYDLLNKKMNLVTY